MSQAGSQAAAFYREVAVNERLWTVEDDGGIPMPMTAEGVRALPVWSSLSRVQRIIKTVPAYGGFRPLELSWSEFVSDWLPDLRNGGSLVGVNWSGPRARGFDVEPDSLLKSVSALKDPGRT